MNTSHTANGLIAIINTCIQHIIVNIELGLLVCKQNHFKLIVAVVRRHAQWAYIPSMALKLQVSYTDGMKMVELNLCHLPLI